MTELEQLQASAEQAAALLKAMGNPKRLLILYILCGSPGIGVGELARVTNLSPSATSWYLARMREEGSTESQHNAQRILYSIKNTAVNSLIAALKTLYCPQGAIMTIGMVSPREAQTLIAQGAKLIDIHGAGEYLHKHIPEAHLAPLSTLEQGSLPANLHAKQVIPHCQSGKRTQNAATKLNVVAAPAQIWLLGGEIDGWKTVGLPVAKDSSQPLPLMRQVQIAAGSLALSGVILGYNVSGAFFLLSGFVGAGLILTSMADFCSITRLLDIMP